MAPSTLLVKTEAEAAELKKRLAAGELSTLLAKKHSVPCPSKKRGGDLGEVQTGPDGQSHRSDQSSKNR